VADKVRVWYVGHSFIVEGVADLANMTVVTTGKGEVRYFPRRDVFADEPTAIRAMLVKLERRGEEQQAAADLTEGQRQLWAARLTRLTSLG
jgi:hypothetical protein